MSDYKELRKRYTKNQLLESDALENPIEMFQRWMVDAINDNNLEPNAMLLTTVDADHRPHARTVLLKEVVDDQFIFYTNYTSNKGKQIAQNPNVTLVFMWLQSQRQIIINGVAAKISAERSTAYFQSRPRGSQIGAWTSPQSSIIKDRTELTARKEEIIQSNKHKEKLDRPDFWGGYGVVPSSIEFWQGRDDRLHDRLRYRKNEDLATWEIIRLAP